MRRTVQGGVCFWSLGEKHFVSASGWMRDWRFRVSAHSNPTVTAFMMANDVYASQSVNLPKTLNLAGTGHIKRIEGATVSQWKGKKDNL
jgi:hypothetical protein